MHASRVLFVAAEAAAALFFLPLWRFWSASPPAYRWSIVLGDGAQRRLQALGALAGLPVDAVMDRRSGEIATILQHRRLSLLMSSAGDRLPLEVAAVRMARERGARTVQVIDTWYNYSRRFEGVEAGALPDQIAVIDQAARSEAIAEGLPGDRLVVVGHPWWEQVRPRRKQVPQDRVLLLGAPILRDYGNKLGYDENSIADVVISAMKEAPQLFRVVWYGPHPEQTIMPVQASGFDLVRDGSSVIASAGTVLGAFSAPMVDAYLAGANVISVQPGDSPKDLCPLSRHGRVPRVRNPQGLIQALQEGSQINPEGMRSMLRGSTKRLVKVVEDSLGV